MRLRTATCPSESGQLCRVCLVCSGRVNTNSWTLLWYTAIVLSLATPRQANTRLLLNRRSNQSPNQSGLRPSTGRRHSRLDYRDTLGPISPILHHWSLLVFCFISTSHHIHPQPTTDNTQDRLPSLQGYFLPQSESSHLIPAYQGHISVRASIDAITTLIAGRSLFLRDLRPSQRHQRHRTPTKSLASVQPLALMVSL